MIGEIARNCDPDVGALSLAHFRCWATTISTQHFHPQNSFGRYLSTFFFALAILLLLLIASFFAHHQLTEERLIYYYLAAILLGAPALAMLLAGIIAPPGTKLYWAAGLLIALVLTAAWPIGLILLGCSQLFASTEKALLWSWILLLIALVGHRVQFQLAWSKMDQMQRAMVPPSFSARGKLFGASLAFIAVGLVAGVLAQPQMRERYLHKTMALRMAQAQAEQKAQALAIAKEMQDVVRGAPDFTIPILLAFDDAAQTLLSSKLNELPVMERPLPDSCHLEVYDAANERALLMYFWRMKIASGLLAAAFVRSTRKATNNAAEAVRDVVLGGVSRHTLDQSSVFGPPATSLPYPMLINLGQDLRIKLELNQPASCNADRTRCELIADSNMAKHAKLKFVELRPDAQCAPLFPEAVYAQN